VEDQQNEAKRSKAMAKKEQKVEVKVNRSPASETDNHLKEEVKKAVDDLFASTNTKITVCRVHGVSNHC
jgi:hypothetical protein